MPIQGDTLDSAPPVAAAMHQLRVSAGLDLEACASALETSREQYQRYEAGDDEPSLPQLEILSRALGVPVSRFWTVLQPRPSQAPALPPSTVLAIRRRMIGVSLRQARLGAGKALAECGEAVGEPAGVISAYELGTKEIPFRTLHRLGGFLGVPMEYFADEELVSPSETEGPAQNDVTRLPADLRGFVLQPGS